ncbi:MAG: 2-C-methyl-D-erythritol 2,4-cyclodiphosphate synthase [Proteobacteria bacterium]|nr:2-C-methyl-D-erythritol 2,4-cyclodiphosphate synthase [Pseudomonadota bacterium]
MMRVGFGYDAHRLVEGRELILGGVTIPFEKGLLGHSDADVLSHAVCDALLGAAGEGDLGRHFPDSNSKFKGISSLKLMEEVKRLIAEKGYELSNLDVTVVCEKPKLAPHIGKMKENIAKALAASKNAVNIKATTTEGMGFAGRKEGIAAYSVVMIQKKG